MQVVAHRGQWVVRLALIVLPHRRLRCDVVRGRGAGRSLVVDVDGEMVAAQLEDPGTGLRRLAQERDHVVRRPEIDPAARASALLLSGSAGFLLGRISAALLLSRATRSAGSAAATPLGEGVVGRADFLVSCRNPPHPGLPGRLSRPPRPARALARGRRRRCAHWTRPGSSSIGRRGAAELDLGDRTLLLRERGQEGVGGVHDVGRFRRGQQRRGLRRRSGSARRRAV